MAAQTRTFESYEIYAQERNRNQKSIEDVEDNKKSVVNALKNLSFDPEWPHFHQRGRIVMKLPITDNAGTNTLTGVHEDNEVTIGGVDLSSLVDDTWVLIVPGQDTEYPIVSAEEDSGDTDLTLEFPLITPDGQNLLNVEGWKLVKREYVLPDNCRQVLDLWPANSSSDPLRRVTLPQLLEVSQDGQTYGTPCYYAQDSKNNDSRKFIAFYPVIEDHPQLQFDFLYARMPRALVEPDGDYVAAATVVDWPDDLEAVMEAAIEVEVSRKNEDPEVLQTAMGTMQMLKQQYLGGSVKNTHDMRMQPVLTGDGEERNPHATVDTSGLVIL